MFSTSSLFIAHYHHAKGSVQKTGSATANVDLGGLIGQGELIIIRSYANVTVSGGNSRASLSGGGEYPGIKNSYGVGRVRVDNGGGGTPGGPLGKDFFGSATNSFWDTETTGLRTANMQVACSDYTTGICALGDGFIFEAGQYPKVKKCLTNCSSVTDARFSDEVVEGQGDTPESCG